jgi:hypothetical protein
LTRSSNLTVARVIPESNSFMIGSRSPGAVDIHQDHGRRLLTLEASDAVERDLPIRQCLVAEPVVFVGELSRR